MQVLIPLEEPIQPWVSKTPKNTQEANSQSEHIKKCIIVHQNGSPTSMVNAIHQFRRGTTAMIYQMALLHAEVQGLCAANQALSKRRRAKKNMRTTWRPPYH